MVKQDLFPAAIGMARRAFRAEITFVLVVLPVTFVAFPRRVLECVARMAGAAFHAAVLAKDIEPGSAMVEVECLPVLFLVAALARLAQRALVLVFPRVTAITRL